MRTIFLALTAAVLLLAGSGSSQGWPLNVCSYPQNMPFTSPDGSGLEDRIAAILADELGAHVVQVPVDPPFPDVLEQLLTSGACDVVMAVSDGQPGYLTTLTYYRSIYAFLYDPERIPALEHFDDPALADYRIGVVRARASGISPVTQALAVRGLIANQVSYINDVSRPDPLLELPEAVAAGDVDVAVLWGPVAGYAARESGGQLVAVPVQPEIDMPMNIMYLNIAIGLRPGDESLRDSLNLAIARRWDDIQAVLQEFNVPLMPLTPPQEARP